MKSVKNMILLSLMFFSFLADSKAQSNRSTKHDKHLIEPIILRDDTYSVLSENYELDFESKYHKSKIFYVKFSGENYSKEFFKIEDGLYYFQEIKDGDKISYGKYKCDFLKTVETDIISVFPSHGYPEYLINKYFIHAYKDGEWNETGEGGLNYSGRYVNGIKEGKWSLNDYRNRLFQDEYFTKGKLDSLKKGRFEDRF